MIKLFKNNKGFTLAELMVAAGIAGAIGLVAVTTLKNTKQASNIMVVSSEASTLKSLIAAQLINPNSCRLTFPVNTPVVRTTGVEIKAANGVVIAKAGQLFGPTREFSITNISTTSVATSSILKIKVDYGLKATVDKPGKRNYSFDIDVFVNKNAANQITACFLDIAGATKKAVEGSCRGLGAVYNAAVLPFGSCTHSLPEIRNEAGVKMPTNLCPQGQYLQRIYSETNPNKIILQCKSFAVGPCGQWSFINKINNSTGVADCVTLSSLYTTPGRVMTTKSSNPLIYEAVELNCTDANEVLRGLKADGSLDCIPKHVPKVCPADQYVYDVTKTGPGTFDVNCKPFTKASASSCPNGQYLQAINSDGTIPVGGCVAQVLPNATCPSGNVMIGINSSGVGICQVNPTP